MSSDDKRDDDFDPWAELESTDDVVPDGDGGREPLELEGPDDLVSDWLADDAGENEAAALGVFVPEEEPELAGLAFEPIEGEATSGGFEADDTGVGGDPGGVPVGENRIDETAATPVAPLETAPVRTAATKGGWGQVAGVVLGGAMAVPVTLGILAWGFRQDPLNVMKHVPEPLAFLVPGELRPRVALPTAPPVAVAIPAAVDVPAVATDQPAGSDEPMPDAEPVVQGEESVTVTAEPATDLAAALPSARDEVEETLPADAPVSDAVDSPPLTELVEPSEPAQPMEPGGLDGSREPAGLVEPVVPEESTVAVAEPEPFFPPLPDASDSVAAVPAAEPVALAEPVRPLDPPLDFSAVDESAVAARAAFEALASYDREAGAGGDASLLDKGRTMLLVEWYRKLAAVAETSAGLERTAADSGSPLAGPPASVRDVQADIVAEPARLDQLARLARNWFSYPGRRAAGVMVPGVLAGTRQVGPYWCSTVTVAEAGGRSRDLAIVSRTEPPAVAGGAVLVTGLIIDGDVVWASDVCPATPEGVSAAPTGAATADGRGGSPPALDPFAAPVP